MWINSRPENSKISRYETFKQVEKSTGKTPKDLLNAPKLTGYHQEAWAVYVSLNRYDWSELKDYIELTGHELEQWEMKAIMELAKYRESIPSWQPKSQN